MFRSDDKSDIAKESESTGNTGKVPAADVKTQEKKGNKAANIKGLEVWEDVLKELKDKGEWFFIPISWIQRL